MQTIVYWLACAVLIAMAYRLGCKALGVLGAVARSDASLLAEVLVLRQQNAVLRRQIARVRYQPADRAWFAALSALILRARWARVFPVTPRTLLAWHEGWWRASTPRRAERRVGHVPALSSRP